MNQKQQFKELRIEAGSILGTFRCWCCRASNRVTRNWTKRGRSGFVVHHCDYVAGERIHSDFPKTLKGRIEYYTYLLPILKKRPNTRLKIWWRYLCNKCHINFSKHFDRKRMGDQLYRKMCALRRMSQ